MLRSHDGRLRGVPVPPRRPGKPPADLNPGERHPVVHHIQTGEPNELTRGADLDAQKPKPLWSRSSWNLRTEANASSVVSSGPRYSRTSGSAFMAAHGEKSDSRQSRRTRRSLLISNMRPNSQTNSYEAAPLTASAQSPPGDTDFILKDALTVPHGCVFRSSFAGLQSC